jgi:hypothetical protein
MDARINVGTEVGSSLSCLFLMTLSQHFDIQLNYLVWMRDIVGGESGEHDCGCGTVTDYHIAFVFVG